MKKKYCRPELKQIHLMSKYSMLTDSKGLLNKDQICTRKVDSFDDEVEEEITNSVWFSDN